MAADATPICADIGMVNIGYPRSRQHSISSAAIRLFIGVHRRFPLGSDSGSE
jgi:hypothetical protein